ncbi:MAG TPA: Uma2 family endonuclease [Gemmataceae bacterium]|jgi:Uma2 family endonuclease|nr:Uma2 family endonuclease [Gemmataceae bacterium]
MSVGLAPLSPGYLAQSGCRRLTVPEFHNLIDTGFLAEDEKIQLLEGYMVPKMPPKPPHSNTVTRMIKKLIRILPDDWQLRSEQPITLAESEPQPDFTLARGDDAAYQTCHPGPRDIGLVIEVTHSSLAVDRNDMGRIYARAALSIYWIINIVDRQVEVYTDPQPADAVPSYATRTDYKSGDSVPLVLDGQVVAQVPVDELLG